MEIHIHTKCGVYEIRHLASNTAYVGGTVRLSRRRHRHFYDMSHGYHRNKNIQSAYDASPEGNTAFAFTVLEHCEPDCLKETEQRYLDTGDYAFNISLNAKGGPGKRPVSEKNPKSPKKSYYQRKGHKLAEQHPKFIGYYHTPFGTFPTAKDASNASNGIIPAISVRVACNKPDATITPRSVSLSSYLQTLGNDCIGKTYREIGFWFEPKH